MGRNQILNTATNMENAVEIKELTKIYNELIAVNRVSFEVRKGEIFGFLGPNGAGKTTTVRILTGVIKPNNGTAKIMGYDVLKQPLRAKQIISVVPETSNAYLDLTAWQNLMLMFSPLILLVHTHKQFFVLIILDPFKWFLSESYSVVIQSPDRNDYVYIPSQRSHRLIIN